MSRLLVLCGVVALAAGCQSQLEPSKARNYKCDKRGTYSDECPGGWWCGQEGVCRSTEVPGNYLCDSAAPKEQGTLECGGWHCGPDGRCYDRAEVGAVACRTEVAEDCAPTWRCGLNGRCHARDVGAAYLCAEDEDCESGWRCDPVRGLCADTALEALRTLPPLAVGATARLSPVLPFLPQLFAGGDFYSHPPGDPDACDYSTGHAAIADGALTFHHARLCTEAYEASYASVQRVPLREPNTRALATYRDSAYVLDSQGVWRYRYADDAGESWMQDGGTLTDFPGFSATDLRVAPGDYYEEHASLLYAFGPQGLSSYDLRSGELRTDLGLPPLRDGGVQPIHDLLELLDSDPPQLLASGDEGLFLAYRWESGYLSRDQNVSLGRPEWVPLKVSHAGNAQCGDEPGRPVRRMKAYSLNDAYLAGQVDGDAGPELIAWRLEEPSSLDRCSEEVLVHQAGPCAPCPAGQTLVSFRAEGSDWDRLSSRCQARVDGGVTERTYDWDITDGGCTLEELPVVYQRFSPWGEEGMRTAADWSSNAEDFAADEYGRSWMDQFAYGYDRAPTLMVGGDQTPLQLQGPARATINYATQVEHPYLWQLRPGAGMVQRRSWADESELCAPVQGEADWVLRSRVERDVSGFCSYYEPLLSLPAKFEVVRIQDAAPDENLSYCLPRVVPVAVLNNSEVIPPSTCLALDPADLTKPARPAPATLVTVGGRRGGGREMVVAVTDTLWGGALPDETYSPEEGFGGAGSAQLDIRASPVPRGRITSLTLTEPTADSPNLFTGYLIAQGRVFQIAARDELQWRTPEVDLPEGLPVDVWADGHAGRVGFSDGRVYGLPVPVPLAAAFPAPGLKVERYAAVCGAAYALTAGGVFRLEGPQGGSLGRWTRVPLEVSAPGSANPGYAGGKLHVAGNTLFVMTAKGVLSSIVESSCP